MAEEHEVLVNEEYALWLLLVRTYRAIAKARERELQRYGISADGGAILLSVLRQGVRATPSAVAREVILEPHSVSQQVTRMEKEGLVAKIRDLEKKNQVRIALTQKGYKNYLQSARRPLTRNIMSELSAEEQRTLWLLLVRLRRKAMKRLKMRTTDLYPPSNPAHLAVHANDRHQGLRYVRASRKTA